MPALLTRMSSRPCRSTMSPGSRLDRRGVGHVELHAPRRVPPAVADRRDGRGGVVAARGGDDRRALLAPAASRSRGRCRATHRSRARLCRSSSNMSAISAGCLDRPRDRRGCRSSTTRRLAMNLAHQPAQHRAGAHLNIRCDAFRRKAPHHLLPAHRRRHLRDQRLDRAPRASRFGSASTLATIGTRGSCVASARSSGASRSSAGFISAQ